MGDTVEIAFSAVTGVILVALVIFAIMVCRIEAGRAQALQNVVPDNEETDDGKQKRIRVYEHVEKSKREIFRS